ncbi:hypothetical protein BC826DRAFT_973095 [Russula brevipes]|nr:hypothetical protein BC826DRAFT_973095 [Russula brevipes]
MMRVLRPIISHSIRDGHRTVGFEVPGAAPQNDRRAFSNRPADFRLMTTRLGTTISGSVALRPVSVAPCQRPPALDAKHRELALPQRHVRDSYMVMAMMSVGIVMGMGGVRRALQFNPDEVLNAENGGAATQRLEAFHIAAVSQGKKMAGRFPSCHHDFAGVTLKLRAVPSFPLKTPSLLHLANPEEADAPHAHEPPLCQLVGPGAGCQASSSMAAMERAATRHEAFYSIGNCDTCFVAPPKPLVDTAPPAPFAVPLFQSCHGEASAWCDDDGAPQRVSHSHACMRACGACIQMLQGCPLLITPAGSAAPHAFVPGDSKPDNAKTSTSQPQPPAARARSPGATTFLGRSLRSALLRAFVSRVVSCRGRITCTCTYPDGKKEGSKQKKGWGWVYDIARESEREERPRADVPRPTAHGRKTVGWLAAPVCPCPCPALANPFPAGRSAQPSKG